MKKWILILLGALLLTACQQDNDIRYFIRHPDALKAILERCHSARPQNLAEETSCQFALTLAIELTQLGQEMMENPATFGRHILTMQTILARFSQKENLAPEEKRKQDKLHHELKLRLMLAAAAEGM